VALGMGRNQCIKKSHFFSLWTSAEIFMRFSNASFFSFSSCCVYIFCAVKTKVLLFLEGTMCAAQGKDVCFEERRKVGANNWARKASGLSVVGGISNEDTGSVAAPTFSLMLAAAGVG
jgi:hypothetical protein